MPTQYSHRQFFRRVPNHQLENYFKSKKTDLGIDFSKLKDKEVDSIFNAFANLPTEQQASYEGEFQDINAMACEAGIAAIESFHGKSIWAFLNKPEYWRGMDQ